jgi:hypothetical protein
VKSRGVNLLSPTVNLWHYEIIDIFGFVLPNTLSIFRTVVLTAALCIERSNCKLPSRKGAPLIAIKRLELASVIRQDSCHFEWALGLRLDKFEQICGQWRICSEDTGKMEDGSKLL